MRRWLVLVLLASACGRLGFADHDAAGGGGGDGGTQDTAADAPRTDGHAGDAGPDAAEVTTWRATTPLPTKRDFGCAVSTADHVYYIGGGNDDGTVADVLVAPIGTSGMLGAWTASTPLPITTAWHACAIDPETNELYVVGGDNGTTARANAWQAQIAADGSVGAWTALPPLPGPRRGLSAVIANGVLYAIGGESADGFSLHADVFELALNVSAPQWGSAAPLPTANYELGASVVGDRIYTTGGYAARTDVVWSDGTAAFAETTALPAPRERHAAVTVGNAIYAFGGEPMFGDPPIADAVRATVAADGSVGAWETLPPLPAILVYGEATSARGRVYVLGGANGGDFVDTVSLLSPP